MFCIRKSGTQFIYNSSAQLQAESIWAYFLAKLHNKTYDL